MKTLATETAAERVAGGRPGRARSLAVAGIAALATGALVYRMLRGGGETNGG
jgi:hypothetical protein